MSLMAATVVGWLYVLKDWTPWAATVVGVITGVIAVRNYGNARRLEKARWALQLYEKFYEREDLKEIRKTLDGNTDTDAVTTLVKNQPDSFTDYLNFFEFIAFLWRREQMSLEDVNDLFDYYLECLWRHSSVAAYIGDTENGYEQLSRLLRKRHNVG